MKYLKKINLKNFQSHKDTSIELDKGLNIIVGPSDTGKTAIIRGIKWVLYNEPSGDYFIREGETEASVTLEFSNGIKVKRLRTRSKNAYILYDTEGEEVIFEGFGTKVPQEIVDFISIKKIPLDNNEANSINLGEQLEGAFLLSEKGSTRASAIGRLIGVNIIDDALKETLKDIRNSNINKKSINENISNIENELKTFDYLDKLQDNIKELDKIKETLDAKVELKNLLSERLRVYSQLTNEKKSLNKEIEKLNKVASLEKNIYLLENKNNKLKNYNKLNLKYKKVLLGIQDSNSILNKLRNLKYIERDVSKIDILKSKMDKLERLESKLIYNKKESNNIKSIYEKTKHLDDIRFIINKMEDKVIKLKSLNILLDKMNSTYKSISIGNEYLSKLGKVEEVDSVLANAEKAINLRNDLFKTYKNLNLVKSTIKEHEKILKESNKKKQLILKKYESLLEENGRCPFCLSEINVEKINHIIDHHS